jgi:hypothetical protein
MRGSGTLRGHPCVEITRWLIPPGEIITVIQRTYISPGSTAGPDPAMMLNPVAIVFDGRERSASTWR